MKQQEQLTVALLVVIGVAGIGFLRGTSTHDYDLTTPKTEWEEHHVPGVEHARSYSDARSNVVPDGEVVRSCFDCHEERKTEAAAGRHQEHPLGVVIPAGANLAALAGAGGRTDLNADGKPTVVCRSCHRPHHTEQEARLIAPMTDGTLCAWCHVDQRPGRSNHAVSGAIDRPVAATIRAMGGEERSGLTCMSCHGLHETKGPTLLRRAGEPVTVCAGCHPEQRDALTGKGHGGADCSSCHGMHGPDPNAGRGKGAPRPEDARCVDCHTGGGKAVQVKTAGGHPLGVEVTAAMKAAGAEGTVGCRTCHVPHAAGNALLGAGSAKETCLGCHPEQETVVGTNHDAAIAPVGGKARTCVSCHAVHGAPLATPPTGVNPAAAACLACHREGGLAKNPGPATHPEGLLLTTGGLPFRYEGKVPYFGPDGRPTQKQDTGIIACPTCHDVHRWTHDDRERPGKKVDGTEQNSFLRNQDEVVEFCAVCHGFEARPQFRFFHRDSVRTAKE